MDDLFFVLNNPASSVDVSGAPLHTECKDCLRLWLDDLMRGVYRPLPCKLPLSAIVDYIAHYLTPPPHCIHEHELHLAKAA